MEPEFNIHSGDDDFSPEIIAATGGGVDPGRGYHRDEFVRVAGIGGLWRVDRPGPAGYWLHPVDSEASELLSRQVFDMLLARSKNLTRVQPSLF